MGIARRVWPQGDPWRDWIRVQNHEPRRVTYASFCTSRELSIVIVEIDTGASADEDLQIVGSRDQGNSSRNHQTPTLLDRQARFLRETLRVEARLRNSRKRRWGTRPVPP
ncbi:unnamed protein product [Rangifer tarandus platyrhynchus]|uniref:Uncharacterized protein n=1 Tax=Rangifer tarandus platyrhynchus TaxID=3082113 RepID=A0AC59Y7M3_RANTA